MKINIKSYHISTIIAVVSLFFCSMVFALELDDAKQRGLIGEQTNGYLGVRVMQNEVQALVGEINAKRRAKYLELAAKNNITLQQVETLAANKAYEKTEAGHFIQVKGVWLKK
ncbi:MAG: hypothetical protein ACI965_000693 [Paraglaciecola sp.]|jgi:uncharacterized protein YdbL (DUF1318 family)